jgi:hypothetical protein
MAVSSDDKKVAEKKSFFLKRFVLPIWVTVSAIGPVGWLIVDICTGRTDRLVGLIACSVIFLGLMAESWYLAFHENE